MSARSARNRLWRGTFAAILLVLVPSLALAGEVDVFDRPVPFGKGRPTVTLLANADSAATVSAPMAKLSFALRDINPVVIVRVDLRGIPGLVQGIARSRMRTSHEAGLENFRHECELNKVKVPPNIADGLFFVADGDGALATKAGLEKGFATSLAIVYDRAGREVARGPFPADSKSLQRALRRALAPAPVAAKPVPATTAPVVVRPAPAKKASTRVVRKDQPR